MTDTPRARVQWATVDPFPNAEVARAVVISLAENCTANADPGDFDDSTVVAAIASGSFDVDAIAAAADAGDAQAMCQLACWHTIQALLTGNNAPELFETAEQWMRRAIVLGSARALGDLGFLLVDCQLDPSQRERGMRLLRISAAAGDRTAMRNLGIILDGGPEDGFDVDEAEASAWLVRAASGGDYLAQEMLK